MDTPIWIRMLFIVAAALAIVLAWLARLDATRPTPLPSGVFYYTGPRIPNSKAMPQPPQGLR